MTSPDRHSASKIANRGLGTSGTSVERPISCDSSNYTLRYCVTPKSPEKPALSANSHGAINSLQHLRPKHNFCTFPSFSAFEVVEVVRPLSATHPSLPHRQDTLSVRPKTISTQAIHRLATQSITPSSACHYGMRRNDGHKSPHNRMPLSIKLERERIDESSTNSSAIGEVSMYVDAVFAKSLSNRKDNDNHNGSGFKRKSGDLHSSGSAGNFQTKAGARPWHQIAEAIPMKYFMNGVRMMITNPLDVIAPDDGPRTAAVSTLRPSLFSLRHHHGGLHMSLKSLLQTPERHRMSKQAALAFIQDQVDVWYAACQGDDALVAAYIDAGVIVDALDRRYGRTPLQYAAGNNNTAIMRLLLEAGASVHSVGSRDKHCNSPLHFASLYGKTEAAHCLLDNGADGMGFNANGFTPLQLALDNGHTETAALLKKYGAVSKQ